MIPVAAPQSAIKNVAVFECGKICHFLDDRFARREKTLLGTTNAPNQAMQLTPGSRHVEKVVTHEVAKSLGTPQSLS